MKKTIKALKPSFVFLLIIVSFIACDRDFNAIDSDVLGKGNSNFSTGIDTISISAYNRKLSSLQVNNLAGNLLGIYNDPDYGLTTASIITQVIPTTFSPDFGVNPVIDEVVLSIPYYSRAIDVDENGNTTYALDSIYGNPDAEIKLTVYQNNFFLRDFDPNTTNNSAQNYYTNTDSNENSAISGSNTINFDEHIGEKILEHVFKPSADAIVTTTGTGDDETEARSVPALRVVIENNDFWKTAILDKQDDPELSNSNNFKNYFRGLYFKVEEAVANDGNMFLVNLATSNANIIIHYTSGEIDDRTESTYTLTFSGNRLNTFINDYNKVTFPTTPNKDLGDETLYLKGADGSMAVVDLFGKDDVGLEAFLRAYRQTDDSGDYITDNTSGNFILKKLINEAHLEIYEDDGMLTNPVAENGDSYHKYDRIYAYDIDNNASTFDYQIDQTDNTQNAVISKTVSLSFRDSISPTAGKYKIRITEHLNNILLRDSTNTKIGLVLSTNVNLTNNAEILNSPDEVTGIPAAAIITPRGTILHGSNSSNEDKKLRLKVFFTEPN
ncbi:DUF4270 domain-containing protein [Flaviramulus aquimarinus]|uniref:DUF4270 domain-containing protein n=1 Tax=Flaviramulus aquimarinus TaxID=1170456 RepID=A0ABP9EY01_9FLAO